MRSHSGEPAHKTCAESWIAANPTEARLGRFASDIQLVGIAARGRGLAPDEVALVARMTGTTPEAVIREYKRDNTAWAQKQAALDQPDLARLDTHLDEIARQGQDPPCIP
ncbi:hypothetical protein ACFYXM_34435 [Streptomyces sp. NPDC002476]|uniref:hypothetical protein n=1 Tax=Streptomyces sp. NPDC002476 TaxID=3364648 RepID=UPI0036BD0468